MLDLIWVVLGLVLLVLGGNWLLKSSVGLSLRMNISRVVVGLTVVSFATSAPELIVSIKAALDGVPDIAVGNVVGSNIANIALVLGITVLLGTIQSNRSFLKIDWPAMMLFSLVFFGLTFYDKDITRVDGIVLFVMLIGFVAFLLMNQKNTSNAEILEELPEDAKKMSPLSIIILLLLGGVCLWGGSELLIQGAVGLARSFEVSDRVIALTVVSVGTSIPELAASVIAIIKKEKAISLGNLVGSNIFNIGAVIGITSMITPIKNIDSDLLTNDVYWMIGVALLIFVLTIIPKSMQLNWKKGVLLVGAYAWFVYTAIT